METAVSHPPLNPTQLHLLKVFSLARSENSLRELQAVLFDYYRSKLKAQADEYWEKSGLDASKMEDIAYGHNRAAAK